MIWGTVGSGAAGEELQELVALVQDATTYSMSTAPKIFNVNSAKVSPTLPLMQFWEARKTITLNPNDH